VKIETVPAGPKYTQVRDRFGPDLYVCGGWAVLQLIEALDRGVDGMIPESSMIRVYRWVLDAYGDGDRALAVHRFRRLLPILAFANQELFTSIALFKRLLWRKGIFATAQLRSPGYRWDDHNLRIADELIDHYLALEAEAQE
jgi:dihydrodipicolinate synthase/N-acetylneuraminate lyase